jgi:hypothetical protein
VETNLRLEDLKMKYIITYARKHGRWLYMPKHKVFVTTKKTLANAEVKKLCSLGKKECKIHKVK